MLGVFVNRKKKSYYFDNIFCADTGAKTAEET